MITINRILLPTDMSEQSTSILPFAKAMACRFHAELCLLHVLEAPISMYAPPEAMTWDTLTDFTEIRKTRRAALETFGSRELEGVPVSRDFMEGDPATEIIRYLDTHKINLVMMPTHGYGTFRRMLLGSVTAKVLHDATCPVWTGAHAHELQAANVYRRILCAIDTEKRDSPVVSWATEFAKQVGAEVRLFHAVSDVGRDDDESDLSEREQSFKKAHEKIQQIQDEAGVHLEVAIRGGKPELAVHDEAEDFKADLVVIGRGEIRKPFGRLRSSAYGIIRESSCPVISV